MLDLISYYTTYLQNGFIGIPYAGTGCLNCPFFKINNYRNLETLKSKKKNLNKSELSMKQQLNSHIKHNMKLK